MRSTIFLFGEAEKGEFGIPLPCKSLVDLCHILGNPPEESVGISYAVQTLLYQRELMYFRVEEEGFSIKDYMKGLHLLQTEKKLPLPKAIFIPGVGDEKIVETALHICHLYNSTLVLTEKDLYDFLTYSSSC